MLSTYELTDTPANQFQISVTVDGASVPYVNGCVAGFDGTVEPGFYYDSSTNSVVFCGDAQPGPGSEVIVTYPVDSAC